MVRGASKGEGLGNKFLSHIREVDSILQVVRCFENSNIVHVDGNIDPLRDIETINLELIFADLETIEKRLERARKLLKADKKYQFEIDTLEKVKEFAKTEGAEVIPLCVKIEEELSVLEKDEKQEMLEALGLDESGLDKLIKASYKLLGLMSFLTAGEPEVRAWTIKIGTKAPQAAGKIHSDIERGFIKAEVISFEDLMKCDGSMVQAREKGLIRQEGKEYIMQDGDIVLFRFNV